jgi:hypothetical protein
MNEERKGSHNSARWGCQGWIGKYYFIVSYRRLRGRALQKIQLRYHIYSRQKNR